MQLQQTLPSTSNPQPQVDIHEFLQKILFSSDVTDSDNFAHRRSLVFESPEHEMFFAILEEAWWDFTSTINQEKPSARRLFQEVFDWFFNEHKVNWEGSFEHICEMFNFDANYLRKGIIIWVKKKLSEPLRAPEVVIPKVPTRVYPKYVLIASLI